MKNARLAWAARKSCVGMRCRLPLTLIRAERMVEGDLVKSTEPRSAAYSR
jgi:hypothetical protein